MNNAHGFGARAPLEQISEEQFDLSWTSGVKGTWWAMCAARPHMAARGWGRIINMVSLAAERGDAGLGEYGAAKAGIASLTRSAAREWGRQGITANAIAPGAWTKRGQDYAARDPEGFARAMAARPIGRLGDPEADIAPVALFLATDDARFVTGHVFCVDGGARTSGEWVLETLDTALSLTLPFVAHSSRTVLGRFSVSNGDGRVLPQVALGAQLVRLDTLERKAEHVEPGERLVDAVVPPGLRLDGRTGPD